MTIRRMRITDKRTDALGDGDVTHLEQVITTDCVNAHIQAKDLGNDLNHDGIGLVTIPNILNKSVKHRVRLNALLLLKLIEPVARGG